MLLRLQHHCFILLFTSRNDVLILYVLVSLPEHLVQPLFREKGKAPWVPPKRVWNLSETPSGSPSQTLCSFGYGYSIIALFCFLVAGKTFLFLYVLVSLPDHFEGQWPCLSSASFQKQLPLTAHHLRLYASSGTASLPWNCRRNL